MPTGPAIITCTGWKKTENMAGQRESWKRKTENGKRKTEHGKEQPQHTSNERCLSETPTTTHILTHTILCLPTTPESYQQKVKHTHTASAYFVLKTNMPCPLLAWSQSRAGKFTMRYEGSATPTFHCCLQWSQLKIPLLNSRNSLNYNVIVPLCTVSLLKCNLLSRQAAVSPTFSSNLAGKHTYTQTNTHTLTNTHTYTCIFRAWQWVKFSLNPKLLQLISCDFLQALQFLKWLSDFSECLGLWGFPLHLSPPRLSLRCYPSRFLCSLVLLWKILHNNFDATCETFSPVFTCTWQRMPNTDPTLRPLAPHTPYGVHLFNCRQAAGDYSVKSCHPSCPLRTF